MYGIAARENPTPRTFTDQPDGVFLSNSSLIELAKDVEGESEQAIMALGELSLRQHELVGDMCLYWLREPKAGLRLKLEAIRRLPDACLQKGFDQVLALIHGSDAEMLAALVQAVGQKLRHDLPKPVLSHPLAGIVNSLSQHGNAVYFSGRLTKDAYLQASRLAFPNRIPWWKFMLGLSLWAVLAGGASGLEGIYLPAAMMLMLALMLTWMGYKLEQQYLTLWEADPESRNHYFGVVCEEGLDVFGYEFRRFTPWHKLTHWNDSADVMVVVSPTEARVLPRFLFASASDAERAKSLCAAKLRRVNENLSK